MNFNLYVNMLGFCSDGHIIHAYLVCYTSHPYQYNCCFSVYLSSYMPVPAYSFLVNIVCIAIAI